MNKPIRISCKGRFEYQLKRIGFSKGYQCAFNRLPLHERQYKAALGQPFTALESKERKSAKHKEILVEHL